MAIDSGSEKPNLRGEGQLLQVLTAHWIHEDNLYWTQIRHLLLLQLTVFAAWFTVGLSVLGAILMLISAGLSWRLYSLADTIRLNRNANSDAIRVLSRSVASTEIESQLKEKLGDEDFAKYGLFRYAMHSLEETRDAGKRFQKQIFGLCVAANLLVGFVTIHDLSCPDKGWLRTIHSKFNISLPSN